MQDTIPAQLGASMPQATAPQLGEPLYMLAGVTYTGQQYEALCQFGLTEDGRYQMVPPKAFLAYLDRLESIDSEQEPVMCNGPAWLTQFLIDSSGILWRAFAEGLQAVQAGGPSISPLIPYSAFERHLLKLPLCNITLARAHVRVWLEHGGSWPAV